MDMNGLLFGSSCLRYIKCSYQLRKAPDVFFSVADPEVFELETAEQQFFFFQKDMIQTKTFERKMCSL